MPSKPLKPARASTTKAAASKPARVSATKAAASKPARVSATKAAAAKPTRAKVTKAISAKPAKVGTVKAVVVGNLPSVTVRDAKAFLALVRTQFVADPNVFVALHSYLYMRRIFGPQGERALASALLSLLSLTEPPSARDAAGLLALVLADPTPPTPKDLHPKEPFSTQHLVGFTKSIFAQIDAARTPVGATAGSTTD